MAEDKNKYPKGSKQNPVVKPASSQAGLQSAKTRLGNPDKKPGEKK